MALRYDWSSLSQIVSDLKALMGLHIDARIGALESKPEPETYDDTPLKARVDALEAADAAGIDPVTLGRIAALEAAVSELSTQLAGYVADVKPPVEPPADPPAE